jgi:hypothetical protein
MALVVKGFRCCSLQDRRENDQRSAGTIVQENVYMTRGDKRFQPPKGRSLTQKVLKVARPALSSMDLFE